MEDARKTIMLLGGSEAQLIAINKAKELGYRTVVCDYLLDNPGQFIADKYYPASTTDKEEILKIAEEEKIDGIVAYSSDPAAPTAAYVANKMGLPGLDYDMVRHFCEKQLFREFLESHGFNVPRTVSVKIPYKLDEIDLSEIRLPVIVKPTDSSGSKGITVLRDWAGLSDALRYASEYSRNKTLIIEEFIERAHPHVIEAEIFTLNGEVVCWGLINSIRDSEANPLLPAAYSYPLDLDEKKRGIVKSEVSRLIRATGNTSGAFNIEMIIDKNDSLYFLDAGPRNGGNRLPEYISMISGKDLIAATINCTMGNIDGLDVTLDGESGGFWGLGVLHTSHSGLFKCIEYSDLAKQSLIIEGIQKRPGDKVNAFERCNDLVGLNFYKFNSKEEMNNVMLDMTQSAKVILQ